MADVIRVGRGKATVTIRGPLAARLDADLRRLLGPLGRELEERADAILDRVRREWPVSSGVSRAGWKTSLQVLPGEFRVEVTLYNTVPYVKFIRSSKVGRKENATRDFYPLESLVRKPTRLAAKTLRKDAARLLAAALQETFNG